MEDETKRNIDTERQVLDVLAVDWGWSWLLSSPSKTIIINIFEVFSSWFYTKDF